jgi:two-component system, NarL family, nitrate/nitrite response regulator NarL
MRASGLIPLRVLIADQCRIVRAGIKVLLMESGSWQPIETAEAETTEQAIVMLAESSYSVILLDCELPGRGGIKAAEMIANRWPGAFVLGLSDKEDVALAQRMVDAGASGVILRNVGADTLLKAIRTVMGGRRFYSNEISIRLLERRNGPMPNALGRLTAREKQILTSIMEGFGEREIAARLGISKRTLDKHRQHINYKLGTRTPLELVQAGLRLGLIRGPS